MNLTLQRLRTDSISTPGRLYINDADEADTLEDPDREEPGIPVEQWKIPGRTAIPAGRYRVTLEPSYHFHRIMPAVHDVPGFSRIEIHPLNTALQTEGCIGVGHYLSHGIPDFLYLSRSTSDILNAKLAQAIASGEEIWLTVLRYTADPAPLATAIAE